MCHNIKYIIVLCRDWVWITNLYIIRCESRAHYDIGLLSAHLEIFFCRWSILKNEGKVIRGAKTSIIAANKAAKKADMQLQQKQLWCHLPNYSYSLSPFLSLTPAKQDSFACSLHITYIKSCFHLQAMAAGKEIFHKMKESVKVSIGYYFPCYFDNIFIHYIWVVDTSSRIILSHDGFGIERSM